MSDEPRIQCEGCDETYPESEMELESVPGDTLAWCPECTKPSKAQMYGVGRY